MALFRQKLKAQFSMENANPRVIEAEPGAAVARVSQLKKETDESMVEVARVAQEGELLTEEMEVLTDEYQGLDRVHETLESFRSEGGMNPQAAAILNAAMEGFRIRLGMTAAIPSTESFGSSTDRMAMTEISIESISDFAKKIWEAIKKAWNKMVDWVKGLFGKKKESAEKLKARFKELKDAKLEGKVPSDAGFEFSKSKDTFWTDKLVENPTDAVKMVDTNILFGTRILESIEKSTNYTNKVVDLVKRIGAKDDAGNETEDGKKAASELAELSKATKDFYQPIKAIEISGKTIPEGKGAEGFSYTKAYGYFFGGGIAFYGEKKGEGDETEPDVQFITPEKREGKDGKLSFPEWGAVASSAEKVYKYLDNYTEAKIEEAASAMGKVADANPKGNAEAIKKGIAKAQKALTLVSGKLDSAVLSGLSVVADYYEACKDAHKKD